MRKIGVRIVLSFKTLNDRTVFVTSHLVFLSEIVSMILYHHHRDNTGGSLRASFQDQRVVLFSLRETHTIWTGQGQRGRKERPKCWTLTVPNDFWLPISHFIFRDIYKRSLSEVVNLFFTISR